MKRIGFTLAILLFFLAGIGFLCYPSFSSWYNARVGSYTLERYHQAVAQTTDEDAAAMLNEAMAYNASLAGADPFFIKGEPEGEAYIAALDVLHGMMGSVVIDKIGVNLPIYHGTDETVLQQGIGHLEGSALPTGELSNHTVLTGHTGLPNTTLFTNLDQLEIGDTFTLKVLNEVFTYEVFNIIVVAPDEVDALFPVAGKNIVTLITCTPYGINSHRLLVQGEQISHTSALDQAQA